MKRTTRKAVSEYVRDARKNHGVYAYRGRTYKSKSELRSAVTDSMESEAAEDKKLKPRRAMRPIRISEEMIKDMAEERREREESRPRLSDWGYAEKPHYIAISKHGFGISQKPAQAILRAQRSVPLSAHPSQMVIYRHSSPIEPTGFITWPNGEKPTLVGLTNTHQGWRENWK